MNKFYAVWRQNGGGAPNKRHETKDLAIEEANRLATQSQDGYYILEVIGIVEPIKVPILFTEIVERVSDD